MVDTISPSQSSCGCSGIDLFESGNLEEAHLSASGTIESDGTIQAGIRVAFQAATTISLLPGFTASKGSTFSAKIAPCGTPAPEDPFTIENLSVIPNSSILHPNHRSSQKSPQQNIHSAFHSSVWPNPTSKACTLSFTMPTPGTAQVTLWSPHGHLIATPLPNSPLPKGNFQIPIPTQNLPKGIYFLNINSSTGHQTTHRLTKIGS